MAYNSRLDDLIKRARRIRLQRTPLFKKYLKPAEAGYYIRTGTVSARCSQAVPAGEKPAGDVVRSHLQVLSLPTSLRMRSFSPRQGRRMVAGGKRSAAPG